MNIYKHKKQVKFAQSVGGATILEVMISVFLLTFGILALMAAQIRSVAGVSEALNRTLISQAAESLAEGMQANPTQVKNGTALNISYADYIKAGKKPDAENQDIKKMASTDFGNTKSDLASAQINNFEAVLNSVPDVNNIAYIICSDVDAPAAPTMDNDGNINGRCVAGNAVYIKVAWQTKNPNNSNNESVTHTFMYKVSN